MMSEDEVCQEEIIATRPVRIIADDADLFIGALVNVHEPGPSGFYGCGNITQSGVITFEALNWIAATINQEHGLINGKKVVESFIPGVKIGKKIIIFCSHHSFSYHSDAERLILLITSLIMTSFSAQIFEVKIHDQ